MDITITPKLLSGTVNAIPSKSMAHRYLICAAFADRETTLICPETSDDIEATAECLNGLNAIVQRTEFGYRVVPVKSVPSKATLNCRQSGSTLRFLLPIVGALGVDTVFLMSDRLPQRPITPLWDAMEQKGCTLIRPDDHSIRCTGQLQCGAYSICGNISSQFITGLLFAFSLMPGTCSLQVTDGLVSRPYVDMTLHALRHFGIRTDGYSVYPSPKFLSPGIVRVEGDWSSASYFLAANSLGSTISVKNLRDDSLQADRATPAYLTALESYCTISAADIPDLVPTLCIAAAAKCGAVFTDLQRLRGKESDRVSSIVSMLRSFGIRVAETENALEVFPGRFHGGVVDSCNDHRIAMSAAIGATIAHNPVRILNADCVQKSYPAFWQVYHDLGGIYEQHIR